MLQINSTANSTNQYCECGECHMSKIEGKIKND